MPQSALQLLVTCCILSGTLSTNITGTVSVDKGDYDVDVEAKPTDSPTSPTVEPKVPEGTSPIDGDAKESRTKATDPPKRFHPGERDPFHSPDGKKSPANHTKKSKPTDTISRGVVEEGSMFCETKNKILLCNFRWTNQIVHIEEKPKFNGVLQLVVVENVYHLIIAKSVCFDLTLRNIAEAKVIGNVTSSCSTGRLMNLKNVTLNHVTDSTTSLHATHCNISSIVLKYASDRIFVDNSYVYAIKISGVVKNKVDIAFQDTVIEKLEGLYVSGKSTLLIRNCTIRDMSNQVFILDSSENVIKRVSFPTMNNKTKVVLLRNGSDVSFTNITGSFKIKSVPCPRPPLVTPCPKAVPSQGVANKTQPKVNKTLENSPKVAPTGGFPSGCKTHIPQLCPKCSPVTLIFLLISLFINFIQMVFNQPRELCIRIFQRNISKSNEQLNCIESGEQSIFIEGDGLPFIQTPATSRRMSVPTVLHIQHTPEIERATKEPIITDALNKDNSGHTDSDASPLDEFPPENFTLADHLRVKSDLKKKPPYRKSLTLDDEAFGKRVEHCGQSSAHNIENESSFLLQNPDGARRRLRSYDGPFSVIGSVSKTD